MWDAERERAERLLLKLDGYGEIRMERRRTLSILMRNGRVDDFSRSTDRGGYVRVLAPKHGFGVAVFNDPAELERAFEDALAASRAIVPEEPIRLRETGAVDARVVTIMEDPFDDHGDDIKIELLLRQDAAMRERGGAPLAVATSAYGESRVERFYANTFGSRIIHDVRRCSAAGAAQAKRDGDVQQASARIVSRRGFSELDPVAEKLGEAADVAVQLLDARPVKGGVYTVVLDPRLAGVFIHEAFGHLSEADFLLENPQAREMMVLGRRFGPEFLNVFDDGSVEPAQHGTIHYDDEGCEAGRSWLIREGELTGRLHSRETAARLGEDPTGNARAQNYGSSPIVRMTNTGIEAGPHPADQIFDGIETGVYAVEAYGGQTQLESFSFSAARGYMIRDGRPAELVRDVVLQGNLFNTLANVEQVADDFAWTGRGGTCRKGGQSVPVENGAPHVRIRNVTVGGA